MATNASPSRTRRWCSLRASTLRPRLPRRSPAQKCLRCCCRDLRWASTEIAAPNYSRKTHPAATGFSPRSRASGRPQPCPPSAQEHAWSTCGRDWCSLLVADSRSAWYRSSNAASWALWAIRLRSNRGSRWWTTSERCAVSWKATTTGLPISSACRRQPVPSWCALSAPHMVASQVFRYRPGSCGQSWDRPPTTCSLHKTAILQVLKRLSFAWTHPTIQDAADFVAA